MVQTVVNPAALTKLADELSKKSDKMSSEVFVLTYGAFVSHLIHDLDSIQAVNQALMKVGVQMGYRLIEDFLAQVMGATATGQSGGVSLGSCKDFKETMEWVTRVGFKLYLGTTPQIRSWSEDGKECVLVFEEGNPLMEFVELPAALVGASVSSSKGDQQQQQEGLVYGNMLCGVLKGALEMVQIQIEAEILYEDQNECIKVRLLKYLEEEAPPSED